MPPWLGLLAAPGQAAALVATYSDNSWHTDKGRDEFWAPPHVLLYSGVLVAALAVAFWGLLAWRSAGWGARGIRLVLGESSLLVAAIGGFSTLAGGPVDNAWHELYGRDAVIWSPPHLLAIAGVLALAVGQLAGLSAATGRGAGAARLFAGAGVIGALQIPVLEYDADVPQFPSLWYLPVAALGLCLAAALLDDLLPGRWTPTQAALVYTVLRAGAVGLLSVLGSSLTVVPPVLALFLVGGVLKSRAPAVRLITLGALSPLLWWVALRMQSGVATSVPAGQLAAAVALGAGAGLIVAMAHGDLRPSRTVVTRTAVLLGIVATAVGGWPRPAWAHDPGQGNQVREGLLSVQRIDDRAELAMALPGTCRGLTAVRTVARRAGDTRIGTLGAATGADDTCRLSGTVAGLTPGRWFVYAELTGESGQRLETWLPTSDGAVASGSRGLYEPAAPGSSASRDIVGAGLLLVVAGLVLACLRSARRGLSAR